MFINFIEYYRMLYISPFILKKEYSEKFGKYITNAVGWKVPHPVRTNQTSSRLDNHIERIIFVEINGKSLVLNVKDVFDVKSIKIVVQEKEGIPKDLQRLIFCGKQLDDNHISSDLPGKSTIHLNLRIRGGGLEHETSSHSHSFRVSQNSADSPYSNLNLNKFYKSSATTLVQPKSLRNDKKMVTENLTEMYYEKANSKPNYGLRMKRQNYFNLHEENQKGTEKGWKSRSNATNSSNLSLHITAFENIIMSSSGEGDSLVKNQSSKEQKSWQHFFPRIGNVEANPFEFPRQQENSSAEPEIVQFKASQKLLNPNADCFFSEKRTSRYETQERSPQCEVCTACDGSLTRLFDELQKKPAKDFPGCTLAELLLARGAAIFDKEIEDSKNELMENKVCEKHIRELGLYWEQSKFNHVITRYYPATRSRIAVCSMPQGFGVNHILSNRPFKCRHKVTMQEAAAFLLINGKLIHPGTPICENDANYLKGLLPTKSEVVDDESISNIPLSAESNGLDVCNVEDPTSRVAKSNALKKLRQLSPEIDDFDDLSWNSDTQKEESKLDEAFLAFSEAAGIAIQDERKAFQDLSTDRQKRKVALMSQFMNIIAQQIAPSNPEQLVKVFKSSLAPSQPKMKEKGKFEELLSFIKAQYKVANSCGERIAVLSQVVHVVNLSTLQQLIPGLTNYQYKAARFEACRKLEVWTPPIEKHVRIGVELEFINVFIEFITSSYVMVGLPYGTCTAKLPNGKKYEIPSTIRKQRDYQIMQMFYKYVKEIGREEIYISETVMRRILKVCSAHRQKSLHCVDYLEGAGKKAFDNLIICIENMHEDGMIDSGTEKSMKMKLLDCRLYFSTDYALHIKPYSSVADHCINYALSDSKNPDFCGQKCEDLIEHSHNHKSECDRCQLFVNTMKDLFSLIEKIRNDVLFDSEKVLEYENEIQKSNIDIFEWKKHVLRAVQSELTRLKILENLKDNEALITMDYSQKFLPRYYYETQRDYYGKKGLSWHITNVTALITGVLGQHTIVHCLGYEEQNAKTVTAIAEDVLKKCKNWNIVNTIWRCDNAGYYRNPSLLFSLPLISLRTGVIVEKVTFSEIQAGKGPSDMDGARCKGRMKDAVDNKANITTADEMFDALLYGEERLTGLTAVVASVNDKNSNDAIKIPGISTFSEVRYDYVKKEATFWKHSEKGNGKTYKFVDNCLQTTLECKKTTTENPSTPNYVFWRTKGSLREKRKKPRKSDATNGQLSESIINMGSTDQNGTENIDADSEEEPGRDIVDDESREIEIHPNALHKCPETNCCKSFKQFHNLINHVQRGSHKLVPEKKTLYDHALNMFVNQIEQINLQKTDMYVREAVEDLGQREEPTLEQGWALRQSAQRNRFSEKVHTFVDEEMAKYQAGNQRIDTVEIESLMARARDEKGRLKFSPFERLNANQISSLVMRKLKKADHQTNKTKKVIQEEINDEIENETGEIELEYEDDDQFLDDFQVAHEAAFNILKELNEKNGETTTARKSGKGGKEKSKGKRSNTTPLSELTPSTSGQPIPKRRKLVNATLSSELTPSASNQQLSKKTKRVSKKK
uniref:Ubiquitin-like domain-containing protein n=1 Tax=Panagrolaimus davidi TaxID=227884 RepID=A0A914NYN3_9BILA